MRSKVASATVVSLWGWTILLGACVEQPDGEPVASGGAPVTSTATAATSSAASEPDDAPVHGLDLAAVMRRVHFAYRPEGEGFTGGHGTYGVRVGPQGRVELTPCRPAGAIEGAPRPPAERGASLTLETAAIERGETQLAGGEPEPRVETDGSLVVERGPVTERLENGEDGVTQRWTFVTPPAGEGGLRVRVRATGQAYVGLTAAGHHFADPASGLGFRYGAARWTDASGARASADVTVEAGDLVLTVPPALIGKFPAELEATVGPEFGLDRPVLAGAPDNQAVGAVAFGASHFLVVWIDQRSGQDVVAARVNRAGTVLDPSGIVVTRDDGIAVGLPDVAFDGTNFLVVWTGRAQAALSVNEVRAARVSTSGLVLDVPSIPVLGANSRDPAVAFDGENYLVVGQEDVGWNVVAARVTRGGSVLDAPPIPVTTTGATGVPASADVAFDGTNYLIVWSDPRNGFLDIFATRMSKGGRIDPGQLGVDTSAGDSVEPAVAFDGTNYLVVYEQFSPGGPVRDVRGQLVSTARALVGGTILISAGTQTEARPAVDFDGRDYLVVWEDNRAGDLDIYGARVSRGGLVLDPAGLVLSEAEGSQLGAALAFDGTNHLVTWTDLRGFSSSGLDVFGARVNASSVVLDPSGVLLSSVVTNAQTELATASDGTNHLVVWRDARGTASEIFGARVSPTGAVLDVDGIDLGVGPLTDAGRPAAAWNGSHYLVVWEGVDPSSGSRDIAGVRVTAAGQVLDDGGAIVVEGGPGAAFAPRVAAGGGVFLVVWQELRGRTDFDVFGGRVSSAGVPLDGDGFAISDGALDQVEPCVGFSGSSFLVAWSDLRAGSGFSDIRAARVTPAGRLLDGAPSSGGIVVSDAPFDQARPALASSGSGHLVVWEDWRGGTADIFGTPVSAGGVLGDPAGRRVSDAEGDQTRPSIAFHGQGYLVVWEDRRSGGPAELFGARLTARSGILQDEGGFLVASGDTAHLAPALTARSGQVLCAYQRLVPSFATVRVRTRLITP